MGLSVDNHINLDETAKQMKQAVVAGAYDYLNKVRLWSYELTPVETGELKRSLGITINGRKIPPNVDPTSIKSENGQTVLTLRYTAPYAAYVNRCPGVLQGKKRPKPHKGRYWDPQGVAKPHFFDKAIKMTEPLDYRMKKYIKIMVKT